jgi:hypothetical protein
MRTDWIVLPLAAASVMIIILAGGCAPKTQGLRDNGPATAVRRWMCISCRKHRR